MHYWTRAFYDIFDKPPYLQWEFWTGISSILLLLWTIHETIKLRKEAQRANWLSIRPTLSFRTNLGRYVVFNPSAQIAFNVFALLKNGDQYKLLKDGQIILALEGKEEKILDHGGWLDLDKGGVLGKISSITILVNFLESKQENYQCLIYQDSSGRRLYAVCYVSSPTLPYDKFFESGYIDELKS